ncbi:DUF4387 domain-containing protein [Alkaliphilus peptidifermentans]|uniref:DUF4387 domain-containing protein n=1 Tax=Alkaliphilus peptidifermentans DSM 18978 TaxID=1120976 RepID=A0A1G5FZW8_9FIRM|nr:DUF4387 domain-containing protein [Alkaliphilus peptidifermentans]SCY44806.1 protein of unknown function [Alkaliphilus peptidifermentans DSM 18978]
MNKLIDLAKILRSKNSGPFEITLDILFDNPEYYNRVVKSGVINVETICQLYNLEPKDISNIIFFEKAFGIKITYNRTVSSGTFRDRDVYGAQQHAPLMDIVIP